MEKEKTILNDAKSAAIRVEFLTTKEELFLYAGAIYSAMKWGRSIDEKNRTIRGRDKSVK